MQDNKSKSLIYNMTIAKSAIVNTGNMLTEQMPNALIRYTQNNDSYERRWYVNQSDYIHNFTI